MKVLTVMGHVGKDAIIREVNGKKVISFNLAVNDNYTKEDGTKVEKTDWFECHKWLYESQKGGISQYIKKGDFLLVEGKPEVKQYKDKNNESQIAMSINVDKIHLTPIKRTPSTSDNP